MDKITSLNINNVNQKEKEKSLMDRASLFSFKTNPIIQYRFIFNFWNKKTKFKLKDLFW